MEKVSLAEARFLLNIIGLDPINYSTLSNARRIFFIMVSSITIITTTMEMSLNFKGLDTFIRASEIMFPQYQLIWKVTVLVYFKSKVEELVRGSERFWKIDEFGLEHGVSPCKMYKILKYFYLGYKIFMFISAIQYIITPWFNGMIYVQGMMICYNESPELPTIMKSFYYILHTLYMLGTYNLVCGFDGLFFYMTGHIINELHLIKVAFGKYRIKKIWKKEERLKFALEHHQFILNFVNTARDAYSILLFHQFVSGFFAVCFGLFLMSKDGIPPPFDHFLKFSSYIMVFGGQMWTFCFAGQLIIDWSEEISDSVFYEGWSNPQKINKLAKIMAIQRSHIAAKLTIGGFADLNLESFSFIMKNSLSFFTFINTLYAEK